MNGSNSPAAAAATALAAVAELNARAADMDGRVAVLGKAQKAAWKAASAAMRSHGPCAATDALYAVQHEAGHAVVDVALPRLRLGLRLQDFRSDAAAALSLLPREEARRVYAEAFPGLSRQKVAADVHGLVCRGNAERRAREAA